MGRAAAEPGGQGWGKGSIQLCEIPTDDEIHDNIVAMWVPEKPVPAGAEIALDYRLYWVADEPFQPKLGRVVATRLGRGGQPGLPRPKGVRKFVVEFLGGPLTNLPYGVKPEMVTSASRGSLRATTSSKPSPTASPATGARNSTSRSKAPTRSRCAASWSRAGRR